MEILSRAHSITEALDETSKGTKFFKVRQKGGFRGLKLYCRTFKTDISEFSITYLPNKAITGKANCIGPGPGNPASIDFRDISEVRIGHSTDTFNALVKQNNSKSTPKIGDVICHRDNCFSIIFNDDTPNLDLIAETTSIRNTWVTVIQHLIVAMKSLDEEKKFKLFLKRQFKNADKDGSGSLSFEECQDLISQLNIKFPAEKVKALFDEADFLENAEKGTLSEPEFIRFSYNLLNRPELRPIFLKYCIGNSSDNGNARMTVDQLCQFMKEEQKYDICREEGKHLIEAFEPSADTSSLSLDGFSHFIMFSDLHLILNPITKVVYQDMTQPLSHYWIASSHNTYLLGNQISGESSVDGYIRSLQEGCRCVELDCWDGSDGEPIIYHGWTLTTKILFKDVIKDAIAKYAFAASDFPLILSIENHCSLEQQDKMADYMRELLGDYLFTDPPDEEAMVMPSPESLKKKILVKAKRLPAGKSPDDELISEDDDDEVDEKRKEKAKKISQKLSDCVNYIHAVHFPGFESEESKYYHMSSFGETKTESILAEADSATKFVDYNTRQISRIYPGAARQDSSNLKILPPWNAGCQIVALNYQTEDKQNFINASKFADNGNSGYILKPDFLRDPSVNYSPLSPSGLDDRYSIQLKIRVISGLSLPKPGAAVEGEVIDPYVKLRIRGHPDDTVDSNKGKTEVVKNNGFNPVWNQEFEFKIKIPALAFLDIKVKDFSQSGTDNDLGMFCCSLLTIQEGYRRVPLKSYARNQDLHPASLLLHVQQVTN